MGQRRRTGSRWLWLTMVGLVLVVGLGLPSAALGDGAVLRVTPPHTLKFGKQPYGSFTTRTVTIANTSERTLIVTVSDQSPDDFSRASQARHACCPTPSTCSAPVRAAP